MSAIIDGLAGVGALALLGILGIVVGLTLSERSGGD